MFGLPILRRKTPIRINEPKCKGSTFGCDPFEPPKLKSALRLAQMVGNHFSVLVSADWERIITWGSTPNYGQTGVTTVSNQPQTAIINWKVSNEPQSIIQVFSTGASNGFTIFLTESNQLYGTGDNSHYILNKPSTSVYSSFNFITENVRNFCIATSIYGAGGSQAYMLYTKLNGKVYGLGVSNVGFGFPSNAQRALTKDDGVASNYLGIDNVKKVFCVNPGNASKSFLLKNDGTVLACGYNTKGCLGVNSNDAIVYTWQTVKYYNGSSYVPLSGVIDIISSNSVTAGGANSSSAEIWNGGSYDTFMSTYFLTDSGHVYTCGSNKFGQLGLGLANNENTTRNYASKTSLSGVTMICTSTGGTSILAATSANELYGWGNNQWGQLGLNNRTHTNTPTKASFPSKKITQMHGGGMYGVINGAFLVVCDDGTLYGAGFNQTYALGLSYPGTKTPDPGPILTFRENEFFGPSPSQLTDSGRYPLTLKADLLSGSNFLINATVTATKTFTLGSGGYARTFTNQIVYVQPNFILSGYGIQNDTIALYIDYKKNIVLLNKPLTADAVASNVRYDQRIRVYQADLCGYGTEMAQKIVTEDGTLFMSGWNQNVNGYFNFNYYANNENVSVPTFFDAKFG